MPRNKITNIIFFGTPDFAVPALKALLCAPFCEVKLVVTQPDRPLGRHHSKAVPSPVKKLAAAAGVKVVAKLPRAEEKGQIGILVAYGAIIPQKVIDAFPLGILNIHPSLLPKYRGSSPIQAAILNQDKTTGVTIMKLDNKMDHGPIVAQEISKLNQSETAGELHNTLAQLGAELLIKTLPDYIAGKLIPQAQAEAKATDTKKLTKLDGRLDWKKSPAEIGALVRAMNPWPGAWTTWQSKKLIIWQISNDKTPAEVQLEGKKRMPFGEFLKGHSNFEITDLA